MSEKLYKDLKKAQDQGFPIDNGTIDKLCDANETRIMDHSIDPYERGETRRYGDVDVTRNL